MYLPGELVASGIGLSVLALVAVVMRFCARRLSRAPILADDALIVVALLFTAAMGAVQVWGTLAGNMGRHTTLIDGIPQLTERGRLFLEAQYLSEVFEKVAMGFIKLSVLFFYRRVFRGTQFDRLTWSLITFVILWTIGYTFATVFECGSHVSYAWNYTTQTQLVTTCVNTLAMLTSFQVFDVLLDITIICIPIPNVWRLQVRTSRKVAIMSIFMLGGLSVAASVVRLAIGVHTTIHIYEAADISWIATPPMYWSLVEASIGVLAACLPTMAPVIKYLFGVMGEVTSKSYGSINSATERGMSLSAFRRSSKVAQNILDPSETHGSSDTQVHSQYPKGVNPSTGKKMDADKIIVEREVDVYEQHKKETMV